MVDRVRDPYGLDASFPADTVLEPTQLVGDRPNRVIADVGTPAPITPTTTATPDATLAPVVPKPQGLNTLYGVDSESFLTEDQRKLARQIQGKFDASQNRRDRELARYGAPMLSSFAEDESLARAMALARGLNTPTITDPVTGQQVPIRGGGGGGGGGGTPRIPGLPDFNVPSSAAKPQTGAQTNAQWQRILGGLASIAPLLFGKDAYGEFLNKGLIQWAKDKLFGPSGQYMSDQSFENLVTTGQLPGVGDASAGYVINPITGMPMGAYGDTTVTAPDIYGPGSGWGQDVIQPPVDIYGPGSGWGQDVIPPDMNWWDFGGGGGEGDWGSFDWGDFGY